MNYIETAVFKNCIISRFKNEDGEDVFDVDSADDNIKLDEDVAKEVLREYVNAIL